MMNNGLPPSPFLFSSEFPSDVKSPADSRSLLPEESAGAPLSQLARSVVSATPDRPTSDTGSRSTPGEKDCASNLNAELASLEAEVSALEAQWARDGIRMNAATFCMAVDSSIQANSSLSKS